MWARCERDEHLSTALAPGGSFSAEVHNGSITVAGEDIEQCRVDATIRVRAGTEKQAQELASQVKVKLSSSGNSVNVEIERPPIPRNHSVAVSLSVAVPKQTHLNLVTHNGSVRISGLAGDLEATTHNGSLNVRDSSGRLRLRTHNGSITCEEISGDADVRTHNGGTKVTYSRSAPKVCSISLVSHNGSIHLVPPDDLSAAVDVSLYNAAIHTELPLEARGEVDRQLKGKIGAGEGRLYIRSHNGSIRILRQPSTP